MATDAMVTVIWPGASGVLQQINRGIWPASLTKLLGKSRFLANTKDETSLMLECFGQPEQQDSPLAKLRFSDQIALCADLCYLHPDRDCLRLFHQDIDVTIDEATQLQAAILPLVETFQGQWLTSTAKHWGLQLPKLPNLEWFAIEQLEGQSINDKLPVGDNQGDWRRLMNEIQMTLFEHPVNQAREANGLLPINAVWFSGAKPLALESHWALVSGEHPLLSVLTKQTQTSWQSSIAETASAVSQGQNLIVLPAFDIDADWHTQLSKLESDIFSPLWQQLRRFRLKSLSIKVPRLGQFQLSRWRSWL